MKHAPDLRLWGILILVAFGGSAFYGASLGHAITGWDLGRGAAWLTLSAGTGWILLGPSLIALGKGPILQRTFTVANSCLIAMAFGEAILAVAATQNWIEGTGGQPTLRNALWVGLSNVVMASALAITLRKAGLPVAGVLTRWVLILDGGGAIAFWIFYHVLFGGRA